MFKLIHKEETLKENINSNKPGDGDMEKNWSGIKSLNNMAPHNWDNKGIEWNNDI